MPTHAFSPSEHESPAVRVANLALSACASRPFARRSDEARKVFPRGTPRTRGRTLKEASASKELRVDSMSVVDFDFFK